MHAQCAVPGRARGTQPMTGGNGRAGRRAPRRKADAQDQDAAAARSDGEALRREARLRDRRRRRQASVALFVAAGVVVVSHILEHAGLVQLFNPALEDIAIGFPTAGGLAIAGGIVLGR